MKRGAHHVEAGCAAVLHDQQYAAAQLHCVVAREQLVDVATRVNVISPRPTQLTVFDCRFYSFDRLTRRHPRTSLSAVDAGWAVQGS